jgi:glucuronoarabinoxylan endo-1,4-beta-xylanase
MKHPFLAAASSLAGSVLALLAFAGFSPTAQAQLVYVVDQFDPSGTGGHSYTDGQIGVIWTNWFGNAFSSLAWDSASDATNNSDSGSMKINLNFDNSGSIPNQFEVYDGFNGISPALNGLQYTNFQCDVRFAQGSATTSGTFGFLQFGIAVGSSQDYFGGVSVPSSNTNWVHVSINLDATADPNLQSIDDVLIHIYGPSMSGVSTLWVDNIKFVGAPPVTTNCVVDWNNLHQRIDGFGASSAWQGTWTSTQADLLFSTNNGISYTDTKGTNGTYNGIGLSLLRNHISFAGSASSNAIPSTSETSIMQMAQARGALVWSTPWTPAAGFKSTNDIYDTNRATGGGVNGGSYNGNGNNTTNLNYASQLANYVVSMKNQGITLYAISVQNEPDANVTSYEACQWSGAQIRDFVTNLHNAMVTKGVSATRIIIPESENWSSKPGLYTPTLSDPNAAADVSIIADHNYDNCPPSGTPASLSTSGKSLWETEVAKLNCAGSFDGSITDGIYWAGRIHLFMTVAQANAWHYWWLVSDNPDNEGLTDNSSATNGVLAKRMFVLGQWSRFVRPGYYRIDANNSGTAQISAYKDTNSGLFAIVAINPNSTDVNQTFNLTNFSATSVTPWITSSNLSLASQTPVPLTGASFTYMLPALSVVTFVGQGVGSASNSAPVLTPVPNQTINAGMTLQVTNVAVDTNLPSQSLVFSLLNSPTNSTLIALSGTNAVFAWRPLVGQANTTNPVAVVAADNGTPNLSATNNFTVTVNPITNPVVGSATVLGGQVNLMVSGPQGPDYTLLTTTNLAGDWQVLYTTNSPVTPLTLADTNPPDPARFYRIQLGP